MCVRTEQIEATVNVHHLFAGLPSVSVINDDGKEPNLGVSAIGGELDDLPGRGHKLAHTGVGRVLATKRVLLHARLGLRLPRRGRRQMLSGHQKHAAHEVRGGHALRAGHSPAGSER